MLILSRKREQKIVISGGIVVTVVEVRAGKVRLGFEGPDDVKFLREELKEKKDGEV